jgi:flavin reductase (DIM6/NTAB) family NADH-FMN oxidoreductase RutF
VVVRPPRIAEAPVSLECTEWGTLQIGANRVAIGLVKRVHLRDELFDAETQRVRGDRLFLIGRMASPHWYCRTRDRFEMARPESERWAWTELATGSQFGAALSAGRSRCFGSVFRRQPAV